MASIIPSDDNQPGLVSLLARGYRRVDRDDDAREIRHALPRRPAQFFEQLARPQRPRHVVEDLGLDLLPT
jgi:hypothetical protein